MEGTAYILSILYSFCKHKRLKNYIRYKIIIHWQDEFMYSKIILNSFSFEYITKLGNRRGSSPPPFRNQHPPIFFGGCPKSAPPQKQHPPNFFGMCSKSAPPPQKQHPPQLQPHNPLFIPPHNAQPHIITLFSSPARAQQLLLYGVLGLNKSRPVHRCLITIFKN